MGAKIAVFGHIIRRKCPVLSSSYELHKKLQNLYASGARFAVIISQSISWPPPWRMPQLSSATEIFHPIAP